MSLHQGLRGIRLWLVLCLAFWLAACATPSRIAGQGTAFDRVGRFAVNLQPMAQPPYAAQGGFSWRDDGRVLRLDLSSPLGGVLARIQVIPGQAVLERSDGSQTSAASADTLLAQVWGYPMPVTGLRYWIQGQATPGSPATAMQRDAQGRLTTLQQDGWEIRLSDYDDQGPGRVRLLRQDAQGQWRLQLIMDRP